MPGYEQCNAEGSAYGACDCSGKVPGLSVDAGADGQGGAGGQGSGAKLPFMAPCKTDDQCESGRCYPFNAKGPHCTKPCTSDAQCQAPSPGCAQAGVCKAP